MERIVDRNQGLYQDVQTKSAQQVSSSIVSEQRRWRYPLVIAAF
jgi:hypothetical protein